MRVLLSGIVAAIAIAVVAGFVLRSSQKPVHAFFSTSSARVSEPGDNLVGKNWSGDPRVTADERRTPAPDSKPAAIN
jgi:hypothetical protein